MPSTALRKHVSDGRLSTSDRRLADAAAPLQFFLPRPLVPNFAQVSLIQVLQTQSFVLYVEQICFASPLPSSQ